ncbi:MAG: hypothetical protein AABW83_04130 [Nanoarchaeota archaeon]|mgnify:CR=1 FL=1
MGFLSLIAKGTQVLNYFGRRFNSVNDKGLDLSNYNYRNSRNGSYLEDKIRECDRDLLADSDVNLSDTVPDFNLRGNLYKLAYKRLDIANGDLAGRIYEFMRDYVFDTEKLDYKNVNDTIKYLRALSLNSNTHGEAKQATETAITVLSHLNDYLVRQSERGKEASSQGLKNYLFGERGVLTKKRLSDMKRVSDYLAKNSSKFREKTNYKIATKENFDSLNISYTRNENGKLFANVNDDNSIGMYTDYGKLYWNVFDKMFGNIEGKVDTRSAVTNYVKRSLTSLNNHGKVDFLKHFDWKKKSIEDYARFVRR